MTRLSIQACLGLMLVLLLAASFPVAAQDDPDYRLLDKFVFTIGGAYSDVDTNIRLDSTSLGIGTEINLEDDLGLDKAATSFDIKFEWQMARRHRLFFSYLDINRKDSNIASRDFQIGDLIIPVSVAYGLDFDITDYRIGYTYYPWLKERWAVGFVFGVRVLDVDLALAIEANIGDGILPDNPTLVENADAVGPLPFLGVEYRNAISKRWLMMARGGWLSAEIGDYKGGQVIIDLTFENRITKRFGVGASLGYSTADLDVTSEDFRGRVDLTYATGRVFGRVFWN